MVFTLPNIKPRIMKSLAKKIVPLLFIGAIAGTVSCNKEEVVAPAQNGPKNFKVRMTDSPGDYTALDVEIASVAVFHQDSGWITLNNDAQFVSVLDLTNGKETQIAFQSEAKAGLYTKLKLTFGSSNSLSVNTSVSAGGSGGTASFDLAFDSPEREVVITIDEEVTASSGADILLDFNVMQSIEQQADEYILDPMITVIEDESTGVQGELEGSVTGAIQMSDGFHQFSAFTNAQGQFLIRGMEDGVYSMVIMPAQAEANGLQEEYTITGVVVAQGKITQMGEITF